MNERHSSAGGSAKAAPDVHGVRRRDFGLLVLGWAGMFGSMVAAAAAALRGLVPNLLYEPAQRFRIGRPEDYLDGTSSFIDEVRLFVQRRGDGFRAMSGVCTHLGCTVNADSRAAGFRCPCHGSVFDDDGRVVEGPASADLPCYAVSMARDGRLVVDRDRSVTADRYLMLDLGEEPKPSEERT